MSSFCVVGQLGVIVDHTGWILNHITAFVRHIERILRHIAEFLDNRTQFRCAKGLIGNASLVQEGVIHFETGQSVVGQSWLNVGHLGRMSDNITAFVRHIGRILRHIAEFLDNRTQFKCAKGLIGNATLIQVGVIYFNTGQSVVRQSWLIVGHLGRIADHIMAFVRHIERILRHIAEFLDNGTQFK
ncbi:hypothetical protein M3197_02565 [Sporosarcina aquimarina]|uniref:hypothetical protein n=1 Tax=Sporosarcina aquimarina TaxID=114975 RepID=UPI00203D7109|nr:hypothetical protein [Sporosarcina aquimarina]MCM3756361.1 hypothetical protein [Sporosarcina aquimarina]